MRRAKDNVVAFAEGRSDGSLRLRLVNLGVNPIKKGDVFVTSGAGGLFRPDVAVAVAARDHPRRRDRPAAQQPGGDRRRDGRADLAARGGRSAAAPPAEPEPAPEH